ncbi:MAG: radical SAM protein [Erysipelotrichaceae bacterium]|nr:radical SAM protein [Erysipelotrichaceae bacterium]MDY5251938.1 radical SAM protein [Erysipelotrichaceae bacterium]
MHFVQAKGILSANNGMNIYRGCQHGCIYCDSRSKCYQINHPFEDIEVKANAIELLEKTLKTKRHKVMVGTGAMSDPYIPLENELRMTRQALEIIEKYGHGVSLLTKSDRILQDLDILQRINAKTKCVVQMTLTTYDENLCKILEPNVCTTKARFHALQKLHEAGIPTIVWLDPILPFINDTPQNINGILDYCLQAKVYGIVCFGMGLTLRAGNREYFYQQLDQHFPMLKTKYQQTYGLSYQITSQHNHQLMKLLYARCKKHHIVCDINQIFKYLKTMEIKQQTQQLSLFD